METISLEAKLSYAAKKLIKELFKEGYDCFQMKSAMEDGEYLKEMAISQEVAEEVHIWLCSKGL